MEIQASGVTTTFRINLRYIESTPYKGNIEDLGVTGVNFEYKISGESNIQTVMGQKSGDFYTVTLGGGTPVFGNTGIGSLSPNTTYQVRAIVANPQGIQESAWQEFTTSDLTIYDNIELSVANGTAGTGPYPPLAGAVLTITNPDGPDWVSRATTQRGLAWIQKIPRGSYAYSLACATFTTVTGNFNTSVGNQGTIIMLPA
jgi:hypothetical protein